MAQGYHDSDVIFTEESLIGFIKSIHDNIGDNYHFVSTIDMAHQKNEQNISSFPEGSYEEEIANKYPGWDTFDEARIYVINEEKIQDDERYTQLKIGNYLRFRQHDQGINNPKGSFVLVKNYKPIGYLSIHGFDNNGNFDNSTNGISSSIKTDILQADQLGNASNDYITNAYITNAYITNLKTALTSEKALTITDPTPAKRGTNGDFANDPRAGESAGFLKGSITTKGGIAAEGEIKAEKVHAAVFNDYAECRKTISLSPGHVVIDQDDGSLICASARLQPGAQVISDTYGNLMGETNDCQTPIAVAGRVLVYPYQNRENYHAGMAVCSAPDGTVDIMTREEIRDYPDCIVGIVSEIPQYEKWGSNQVDVDGRIWIKVK